MADMQKSRRAPLQSLQLDTSSDKSPRPANAITIEVAKGVHAGLWLNKYLASLAREDPATRAQLADDVASIPVPPIYKTFYERWQSNLKTEYHASSREFAVKERMAVGLGNEGVLETSVALHHTYGVPYIPGSALKGLAANYARLMAGDGWQQGSPAYTAVFGDTENAGFVTFFDALYIPGSSAPDCPLRADIITVHHPEYYKGTGAPPADWDSPNPIPFLSATGNYLVALAAPDLDDIWIEKVFELLEEALLVMGIGAKTSSGYGRMRYVSPFSLEAQQIIADIERMPHAEVNQKIQKFSEDWQKLTRQEDRMGVGQAIIDKVRTHGYESRKIKLPWYQELLAFVERTNKGEKA